MIIKIARDFSYTPGPRYIHEGKFSGELFRQELLRPAMEKAIGAQQKLTVDLDGSAGYGQSFLEEAFGGLVRTDKMNYDSVVAALVIISNEQPTLRDKVYSHLRDAHEKEH